MSEYFMYKHIVDKMKRLKTEKEDLKTIIRHFGIDNQIKKFDEESKELIDALKLLAEIYWNSQGDLQDRWRMKNQEIAVSEEIADCLVLINQFIYYAKLDINEIDKIFTSKIERTINRIKEGYYETNK